jgi:hypothetical protein
MKRVVFAKILVGFLAPLSFANDGDIEAREANWAYRLILEDFTNSNPWDPPRMIVRTPEETQRDWDREREYVKESIAKTEYQPKKDWSKIPALLKAARSGDAISLHKLDSYISHNPDWRHRFEVWKAVSSNRGAKGVATYYSELIRSREDTRLERLIQDETKMVERGILDLMREAESGSPEHCFSLYRFFSFLAVKGVETRWGEEKDQCAKYLDLSYRFGESAKVDAAIQNHLFRIGWSSRRGQQIYPHTPKDWMPKFR